MMTKPNLNYFYPQKQWPWMPPNAINIIYHFDYWDVLRILAFGQNRVGNFHCINKQSLLKIQKSNFCPAIFYFLIFQFQRGTFRISQVAAISAINFISWKLEFREIVRDLLTKRRQKNKRVHSVSSANCEIGVWLQQLQRELAGLQIEHVQTNL